MDVQPTDTEVAEQVLSQLGDNPEVESVIVKGHLLQLHIMKGLYHRMASDRERGRKIVLSLMKLMKRLTQLPDITIWVFCEKEKVIEGRVMKWGGDNVNYLNDL